jgi:hypothetical protein
MGRETPLSSERADKFGRGMRDAVGRRSNSGVACRESLLQPATRQSHGHTSPLWKHLLLARLHPYGWRLTASCTLL